MDGGTTLLGWTGALPFWDGRGHYSFGMDGGTTLLDGRGHYSFGWMGKATAFGDGGT